MTSEHAFTGFPQAGVAFLEALAANNDRVWFQAHRADYEELVLEPAQRLVVAVGERLREIAPGVHADPRVNRSLFRVQRDTRFSADKTPYKIHLGVWWWEGPGRRMECPGFYFHLEPPRLLIAAGMYVFPKELLLAFRAAVVDRKHGKALAAALAQVTAAGPYEIWGQHYVRVPRGFDPGHPNAALLRHNGLSVGLEGPLSDELFAPNLVDLCLRHFRVMLPLHRWLLGLVERASD